MGLLPLRVREIILRSASHVGLITMENNYFYNIFYSPMLTAGIVTPSIISQIVEKSFATINEHVYTQKHLKKYAAGVHESTINDLVTQIIAVPRINLYPQEKETVPLKSDSLMHVQQFISINSDEKNIKPNKNRQLRTINRHLNTNIDREKSSGRQRKRTNAPQFTEINLKESCSALNHEQKLYIQRLRQIKEREQNQKLIREMMANNNKSHTTISKGQKIVFDYDGNIQKGVQLKIHNFDNNLKSSINESLDRTSKWDSHYQREERSVTVMTKINEKSARNRIQTKSQIQFSEKEERESLINEIKLSNQKTKIVIDGHCITKVDLQLKNNNSSTMRQKTLSQYLNQKRMQKKEAEFYQLSSSIPLKSKKIELSEKNKKKSAVCLRKQGISVQNQALKRLLTEREDSHYELPRNDVRRTQDKCKDSNIGRIKSKYSVINKERFPKIQSKRLDKIG